LYLNYAPWIECAWDNPEYIWGLFVPSIILFGVYVLGFPLIIFGFIFKNRLLLEHPKMLISVGFIYDNFRENFWWMELIYILRRIFIAASVAVIPTEGKEVVIMIIIVVFLTIFIVARPYQRNSEINAEILANASLLLLIGTGIYYSWSRSSIFSVTGIIIYFVVIGLLFVGMMKLKCKICTSKEVE
jgi:hypothetical protein